MVQSWLTAWLQCTGQQLAHNALYISQTRVHQFTCCVSNHSELHGAIASACRTPGRLLTVARRQSWQFHGLLRGEATDAGQVPFGTCLG